MKDPAVLLYHDKYLSATAEMDADCVGWYTKLILHQYDKGSLPNDIEKLASMANVKFSEFKRFKQVFEQVLKQKFKQNDNGRLENEFAKEILQKRKLFKEKRSSSANIGVVVKMAKGIEGIDKPMIELLKEELKNKTNEEVIKLKDKQVLIQMLEHLRKLYINVNKDKDISIKENNKDSKYAWKIKVLKKFSRPLKYSHPQGAQRWVKHVKREK